MDKAPGLMAANPQGRPRHGMSPAWCVTPQPVAGSWHSSSVSVSSARRPASTSRIFKWLLHNIRVSVEIPV